MSDKLNTSAAAASSGPDAGAITQDMVDACAREEIQFLGNVQDFGCLLVVTSQWIVRNVSANCEEILGIPPQALVSQRLTDLLPGSAMHTLRGKVQVMGRGDHGIRLFDVDLFEDGRAFDIAIHGDGSTFLIEFEKKRTDRVRGPGDVVQALLPQLVRAEDQKELCMTATDAVWAMTGFERVMVYRFEPDFSGLVVAETRGGAAESYLGHRFPASDIPPQARALYTRNLIRIIADVDAPVHPIIPAQAPDGRPTDLSLSITRAVSPIHLQYLRNMGVRSSMSASIIVEGALWGLIACHHPDPHYVDYEVRSAIEMFAQLLAYELALRVRREQGAQSAAALDSHERLSIMFESAGDGTPDLDIVAREIGGAIEIDGIAMMLGGHYHASGLTPTREAFVALLDHVARNGSSRVFSTDNLAKIAPGTVPRETGIGGMLAIPIHSRRDHGVILFRREMARDIVWAGAPAKAQLPDGRLSPRTSFSTWREERRGYCESWSAGDLTAAEVLRVSLLEITLRLSADRDMRSARRNEQQEVVIAELTHRLRNVYATVSAVIESSAGEAGDARGGYVADLQARLAAMKRASDVLTDRSTASSSLRDLIMDEARAYAGETAAQVDYIGPDVLLSPQQRAALTLVIHELTTNAVKYGALGQPEGRLTVTLSETKGGVTLDWRESGGPPVAAPSIDAAADAASSGSEPSGSPSSGAGPSRSASSDSVRRGSTSSGPASSDSVPSGSAASGSAQSGSPPSGSAASAPALSGSARSSSAASGSSSSGSSPSGSALSEFTLKASAPSGAPARRVGFGTTLIDQVVPHELGGTVSTNFAPGGFEARLFLPDLQPGATPDGPPAKGTGPSPRAAVRLQGRALVVEDNTIIAMNAAQSLRRLGAQDVVIAATPDAALSALDEGEKFTFAMVDQDLNGLSSEPVAEQLERSNIPFVMASGLTPHPGQLRGVFGRAPWIEKPYSNEAIGQALRDHFGGRFLK